MRPRRPAPVRTGAVRAQAQRRGRTRPAHAYRGVLSTPLLRHLDDRGAEPRGPRLGTCHTIRPNQAFGYLTPIQFLRGAGREASLRPIKFRMIHIQRKGPCLLPEGHKQVGRWRIRMSARREGVRVEVGWFVLLPVRPQILSWIEFWLIGRKEFEPQATALLADKVPYPVAAMTGAGQPK